MSDTPWCHPDSLYWVSGLNYSIMQDFKVDPELDIEAVTSFEQGQLWTKFHYKNNIFAFMKGFPIIMYWYDPWYHEDDEYTWNDNVIELHKILNNISDDLKQLSDEDIGINMDALDRRIGQVEAVADTLKNLKVDVDATVDRVVTDVKVDLFAELQSGGGSFWGALFAGIAGGVLGGAGQELVGALTSTQSAIKDAVADVATETMKSGLEKATEGITKNLTGKFDALQGVQRATDAIQRGIQTKITQMQQLVHDKFSTLENITSTIDTVIDWKDGKNMKFNFQEGIRDLNNRITTNENRIHTLEQICFF